MTLEDTPKIPTPDLEKGDKVVTIPPGRGFTILPDEFFIMNHNQKSVSLFVEVIEPDYQLKRKMAFIVHLIPVSRSDDLAPPKE